MTEKELVKAAQKGDKGAFCELYNMYNKRLYKYAFYKLNNTDDAQDAVMDCVVSAFEQIKNLRKAEAFPAWIFKILYSCTAKYTAAQIDVRQSQEYDDCVQPFAASYQMSAESLELKSALNRLDSSEKEIVLLCVVAGLNSKEAGRLVKMSAGSVRSKLSRSLAKMRDYLE